MKDDFNFLNKLFIGVRMVLTEEKEKVIPMDQYGGVQGSQINRIRYQKEPVLWYHHDEEIGSGNIFCGRTYMLWEDRTHHVLLVLPEMSISVATNENYIKDTT